MCELFLFLFLYLYPMAGRMYAVQKGIKLDSKSPEAKKFLFGLMDSLENVSITF